MSKNVNKLKNIWVSNNSINCQNIITNFNQKLESDKEMLKEFGNVIIKARGIFINNDDAFIKSFNDDFSEIIDSSKGIRIYE